MVRYLVTGAIALAMTAALSLSVADAGVVVVGPRPVVVAPRPVVVAPRPVVVVRPAPRVVYYGPPPLAVRPIAYYPAPVYVGQPRGVWYYCDTAKGYYPYVARCDVAWRAIPAHPAE